MRDPERIDKLLLIVAIAVLVCSLQGFAVSLAGEHRRVDPHWQRGMSFVRIGLHWLRQAVVHTGRILQAWIPIPLREQEPWFTRIELPRRPRQPQVLAVS